MTIARKTLKGLPEDFMDEAIRELARLYRQAALLIKETAEKRLIADRRRLTVEATRARALLVEVESVLQGLDEASAEMIAKMIPTAYRRGVKQVTEGLKEIGFSPKLTSFDGRFHADAIQVLMTDMQDSLSEGMIGMAKRFRLILRRTQLNRGLDKKITEQIATGVIARQTRREVSRGIAAQLLQEFGDKPLIINGRRFAIDSYAELVARTKSREAVTAGFVNRMVETGNDLVMVTRHGATDACGLYEGRVFSISGTDPRYPSVNSLPNGGPPFHPNSHVAGAIIGGCFLQAVSTRNFEGEIVTVKTSRGNKTTITENHPVATDKGFIPAKRLQIGDCIFSSLSRGPVALTADHQYGPTEVAELVQLCDQSGEFNRMEIPVRSEDFHGEGKEGEIAVVRFNRILFDERIAHSAQPIEEDLIVLTSADTDFGDRSFLPRRDAVHGSKSGGSLFGSPLLGHSRQASFGAISPFFGAATAHEGSGRLATIPELETSTQEKAMDMGTADSKFIADLRRTYPGEIEVDYIVSIAARQFSGHVYCLQSASSIYNADGIIVKNCLHNFAPFVEEFASNAEKKRAVGVPASALNRPFAKVKVG